MCRRIWIQPIYTNYFIIRARGEIFAVGRETDRMNRSGVVADGRQLFGFCAVGIVRAENGFGRPYSHIAIYMQGISMLFEAAQSAQALQMNGLRTSRGGYQTLSIWRNVAAVYFKVLKIT